MKQKRIIKGILSLLLVTAMVMGAVPMPMYVSVVHAADSDSGTIGNPWIIGDNVSAYLTDLEDGGKKLTITGSGAMRDYSYDNWNQPPWYSLKSDINIVEIGDGVTNIGNYAFEEFRNLTSITIPDSVTSIGEWAFAYSIALSSITLPDNLNSIGKVAFMYCEALTSVTIPGGVTSIPKSSFSRCTSLSSVIFLGDGDTDIFTSQTSSDYAFYKSNDAYFYATPGRNISGLSKLSRSRLKRYGTVTKEQTHNGDIAISDGDVPGYKDFYTSGGKVNIIAAPSSGYALATVTVKDDNNNLISVSGTGNERSFIMPEGNVRISATFLFPAIEPTATTGLIYDGNEHTGVTAGTGYTITGNTAIEAGDYIATATLEDGYVWTDGTSEPKKISWRITKVPSAVSTEPTARTGLVANGMAQELITAGTATGGEIQYALGNATEATEAYTASIPTATNAGTYYVWYKSVGDNEHSDSEAKVISVTIEQKVEAHTHKLEIFDAKEPTYTEDGYKEHYECTECGAWFQDVTGVSEIKDKSGYIIPRLSRDSDSDSDDDSDSDSSGSGSGSGSSSKNSASQAKVDRVNNVTSGNVPANHQAETGVASSDVGGNWANDPNDDTWTYTKSDGTLAKSEWMSLDYNGLRYWYYFESDGNMRTNWFDYNNERFYLMPEKDGWRGRMATGWKSIDNKWYYFEVVPGASQGRLYRSTVTPDGHTVGADGAWNGVGATPVGQK